MDTITIRGVRVRKSTYSSVAYRRVINALDRMHVKALRGYYEPPKIDYSDKFPLGLGCFRRTKKEVGNYDVLVACVLAVVTGFIVYAIDMNSFEEDVVYFQTLAGKM